MKLFKPMLPTLAKEIPQGNDWLYEVKYDGFRATIYVDHEVKIVSRNFNLLNEQFPEIRMMFLHIDRPFILDGELVILETDKKANFDQIQQRGRLKNSEKISKAINQHPATFLAFDLLMLDQKMEINSPFFKRKERLEALLSNFSANAPIKFVEPYFNGSDLWEKVQHHNGEGIVAKRQDSIWEPGLRSRNWLKIKNMNVATFFITAYDTKNSFFHISYLENGTIKMIGKVGQGFTKEEKEALITIIKKNSIASKDQLVLVPPSICIEVEFLEKSRNELRHLKFRRFRFDKHWEECTWVPH